MLEKIREGSQGVAAKIILSLVILSFALTGVYSYLGGNTELLAANVNGEEVTRYDLDRAVQNEQARMREQLGDMFDTLAADPGYMAGLRQSVLDRIVAERLIDQKVRDLGLRVSDAQIQASIVAMPEFQVDGRFDNERYQAVLRQSGLNGTQLRDLLRQDMSRQQLMLGLMGSEFVTDAELASVVGVQQQKRDIRYVVLSQSDFDKGIEIEEGDIEQYYQDYSNRYTTPEKIAVEYVELSVAQMAEGFDASADEIEAVYESQASIYQTPERRFVAHMLFEGDDAKQRADEALKRVQQGEAFADVAKSASDDSFTAENGGDLDWMTPGQMDETLDQAIFALVEGGTSDVIQTEYGFQIVHVKTIEPSAKKPLVEVADSIANTLKMDKAQAEFYELQQTMADVSFEVPDSLQETADALGIEIKTTELFERNAAPAPLNNPKAVAAAFSDTVLLDGMNSEVVEVEQGHIIVVRVAEHVQAGVKPLEQVKDSIRATLVMEAASENANKQAMQLVESWKQGQVPEQAVEVKGLARTGQADLDPGMVAEAFKLGKPQEQVPTIGHTKLANGDVAVLAVDSVATGEVESGSLVLKQRLTQQLSQVQYKALVASLRAEADIQYLDSAQ